MKSIVSWMVLTTVLIQPSYLCLSQTDHQTITPPRLISVTLRIYNSPLSILLTLQIMIIAEQYQTHTHDKIDVTCYLLLSPIALRANTHTHTHRLI